MASKCSRCNGTGYVLYSTLNEQEKRKQVTSYIYMRLLETSRLRWPEVACPECHPGQKLDSINYSKSAASKHSK